MTFARISPARWTPPLPGSKPFVRAMVFAQVLTQIGAFALPALLPGFITRWNLSGMEAGWLVGIFFAAYGDAVPVLLALTDRLPARRVYFLGAGLTAVSHFGFAFVADGFWSGFVFRALAGIGGAGAYMPGLKAVADPLEGAAQSRAVSWHQGGVGFSGAVSFAVAGVMDALGGPTAAFLFGGIAASCAFATVAFVMPSALPRRANAPAPAALLDFRPVIRNRAAMAWVAGYTAHTWELGVLRAWGVTFLTMSIARDGAPIWLPEPTVLFTVAGLAGVVISVTGNEMAQRFGRLRVVTLAISAAALLSLLAGASAVISAPIAALAVVLWNMTIYLDSSALTAGTVQAADPARRGATMGLHSMCGYAGGFAGPLVIGFMLDLFGRDTILGWSVGFGHTAIVTLLALFGLRTLAASARQDRK